MAADPACNRTGGDDGTNPAGQGCAAADLCASGWHVCNSVADFAAKRPGGCAGATSAPGSFFATKQSGPAGYICGAGNDDLFGCGTLGIAPDAASCAPLDRCSGDLCAALGPPWSCGADHMNELNAVTKPGPLGGGALCCRD
jgi:hypothetical protein